MVKFSIGGTVGFDTDTFTLVLRGDPSQSVALGATAGRCLQVLLEAQGEIVTKRTLLVQGWEQYGAVVSDNNLSQSIVRIRRALQQLGVDPAVMATVPRIGYRLTGVERITPFVDATAGLSKNATELPVTAQNVEEISQSSPSLSDVFSAKNAQSAARSEGSDEALSAGESDTFIQKTPSDVSDTADMRDDVEASMPGASIPSPSRQSSGRHARWSTAGGIWLAVAAASTALALWAVPALHGDLRTNAPEAAWAPLENTSGNRVFISGVYGKDAVFARGRVDRLTSTPPTSIDDANERYVYINGSANREVFSYFLCRKPIERATAECLSYLLIDHVTP